LTVPARRLTTALLVLMAVTACRRGAPRPGPVETGSNIPSSPTSLSTVAAACARISSCAHPHDRHEWRNPSACVDYLLARMGDPDELPACLTTAALTPARGGPESTCDLVNACLHRQRPSAATAYCAAHPGAVTACDGASLVVCEGDDPDESAVIDCAAMGAKCVEIAQAGGLRTRACVDATRCPPELTRAWCDGTRAVLSCHDGEIERTGCASGSTCRAHTDVDGEQIAMCEVPGHTSCAAPGSVRCDGTRLVTCETHGHFGHQNTVDCAATGLVCSPSDAGARCTKPSPECQGGHPTCEGSAIAFCAAGVHFRVDCADVGLGACEADGRGPDATCRASAQGAR